MTDHDLTAVLDRLRAEVGGEPLLAFDRIDRSLPYLYWHQAAVVTGDGVLAIYRPTDGTLLCLTYQIIGHRTREAARSLPFEPLAPPERRRLQALIDGLDATRLQEPTVPRAANGQLGAVWGLHRPHASVPVEHAWLWRVPEAGDFTTELSQWLESYANLVTQQRQRARGKR